jgi:hypothetical protein
MATFARGIAQGSTIGECYAEGIKHVGIEYLTGQWWWDIYENVIYFGDPKLKAWSPNPETTWDQPVPLKAGTPVGGHDPYGATSHPAAIGSTALLEYALYSAIVIVVGAAVVMRWKKIKVRDVVNRIRRRKEIPASTQ